MRGATIVLFLCCGVVIGSLAVSQEVRAQPDSVRAAILKAKGYPPDHSPRKALWRAIALPGWGQYYNRQYLKIPFVYGGLAGGVFAVHEMNRRYFLYRHAHLFEIGRERAQQNDQGNPYQEYEDEANKVRRRVGDLSPRQLRKFRDKFRRWRDLSIVGTGLFYALTILDAYVSAHLLTFNVGEDLALDVRPTGLQRTVAPPPGSGTGVSLQTGLHLRLRF